MQLVAYGAQDIYLTGNPQITFFKVVYRRHTNFSMEAIEQTFNGSLDFGNKVSATISRNGDLISRMYIECDPSEVIKNPIFVPNPIVSMLKEVELEIGGQRIDKHYNHWMNVWNELTEEQHVSIIDDNGFYRTSDKGVAPGSEVVKAPTQFQRMTFGVKSDGTTPPNEKFATVPLQFWFCRNPGLALPLIALQYHEVKVAITFAQSTEIMTVSNTPSLSSVKLLVDYIYLDTDERRRFAQQSHEYLIEQVQYQSEAAAATFKLNFNHPVKELIWTGARDDSVGQHGGNSTPSNLHNGTVALRESTASDGGSILLKLNGHDRFSARHSNYFSRTQVWQHHSHGGGGSKADAIHVYSFALKPEEHQPSGTCNFSRIDNAQLVCTKKIGGISSLAAGLHIYAVNYNVLRIMSGMGGLAYSN
jgi:hypothetical protein